MRPQTLAARLALVTLLPAGGVLASQDVAAPRAPVPAAASPAAPTGNPANGRILAYTCQGCHGITGYKNAYPSFRIPKIGGQSSQYLTQALVEYRQGKRKHPTMQAQAQSFSDQDIADIAAFLSTLK